jgi:hypothetical protein
VETQGELWGQNVLIGTGAFHSVKDLIDRTSLPLRTVQPPGFDEWVHLNSTKYDPILSRSIPGPTIRQVDNTDSFKCHDRTCYHYVYGFNDQKELEHHHVTQHGLASQSNGGSAILTAPSSVSSIQRGVQAPDAYYSTRPRNGSTSSLPPPPPMYGSPYGQSASPYAPRRSSQNYSFVTVVPRPEGHMHSTHANVETSNQRLTKELGPCLRCKVLKKKVSCCPVLTEIQYLTVCSNLLKCDSHDPCSLCPENVSSASGDFWKAVGCHRGPLSLFTETFAPGKSRVN